MFLWIGLEKSKLRQAYIKYQDSRTRLGCIWTWSLDVRAARFVLMLAENLWESAVAVGICCRLVSHLLRFVPIFS